MQQPSSTPAVPSHRVLPSARPAESAPPAPTSTEIVTRPEPGLARGKWEAPAWVFWVILAVVALGSLGYLLYRMGVLRAKKNVDLPPASGRGGPPSSRMRRP